MEKVCLDQRLDGSINDDLIFINVLKPTILCTNDKISFVVHTALDVFCNVLTLRLAKMRKFGGNRQDLDE
jgi:hypothetical protein